MDALENRIKKSLTYIIRKTFPDDEIPPIKLEFMKKNTKSFHGDYNASDYKIRVGNLSRPPVHILITSLHEAAHHCEYSLAGNSGHQKSFYLIYHKLMITAVQIGLFNYDMAKTVTDTASIRQLESFFGPITEKANPNLKYKKNDVLIYVFDSYPYRKELAAHGYFYNARAKAWEREIAKKDEEEERLYLQRISDSMNVVVTDDMLDLTIFATITVTGNTYTCKDILSSLNFTYRHSLFETHKSGWYKRIRSTQLSEYEKAIRILENTPGVIVTINY